MKATTEYVFKSDGKLVRRVVDEVELAGVDAALNACVGQKINTCPFIASNKITQLHASIRSTDALVWGYIPGFTLTCPWKVYGKDKNRLSPNFKESTTVLQEDWTAPSSMMLAFAVHCLFTPGGTPVFAPVEPYLVARKAKQDGWYRLPLANVWDDGKICRGTGNDMKGTDLTSIWSSAFKILNDAPFNNHLSEKQGQEEVNALFTFVKAKDGAKIQEFTGDWWTSCKKCNNNLFSLITL